MKVRVGSAERSGSWAVMQQIANLGFIGLFSIVLARSVAVDDFGTYSYAITVAGMAIAVSSAGLQSLGIREFSNNPGHSKMVLLSITLIREIAALLSYAILLGTTALFSSGDVLVATAVASIAVFARCLDAPEMWFQSRLDARSPATIRIALAMLFFGARVAALAAALPLMIFFILFVVEGLLASLLILRAYAKRQSTGSLWIPVDIPYTRKLTKDSFPLALSGIANQINTRSDVLILQALLGSAAVGVYAAAARVSELLYVVPVAYMSATFATMLTIRREQGAGSVEYRKQLQAAFDGAFWFGTTVTVTLVVLAGPVVHVLYGERYDAAADILRIHVLACPFVFMAAVLSKWIVAENKVWLSLGRTCAGAALGVALNLVLVPIYGVEAAAWSTVASYCLASYVFCSFTRSTRPVFFMMTAAVTAPVRLTATALNRKRLG